MSPWTKEEEAMLWFWREMGVGFKGISLLLKKFNRAERSPWCLSKKVRDMKREAVPNLDQGLWPFVQFLQEAFPDEDASDFFDWAKWDDRHDSVINDVSIHNGLLASGTDRLLAYDPMELHLLLPKGRQVSAVQRHYLHLPSRGKLCEGPRIGTFVRSA